MSPLYQYYCEKCEKEWEAMHPICQRTDEECGCGTHAKIDISKGGKPVVVNYFSEHLNRQITGPKQKKEVMREMNVEEV